MWVSQAHAKSDWTLEKLSYLAISEENSSGRDSGQQKKKLLHFMWERLKVMNQNKIILNRFPIVPYVLTKAVEFFCLSINLSDVINSMTR